MPKKYFWGLLLVCLIIFMSNLDVVFVNIMEARNFISAREMLTHDNWLHTTLNLEPRYEKPPLPTWLTAISMVTLGKSLTHLRFPAVLAVIFLIFSTHKLTFLMLKNHFHAFVSSLILTTSFYIIFSGRNGQWDIFAHSFMMLAIWQLFKILESSIIDYKKWLFVGIFMGLSILSKGPVSLFALFLPFIIAYGFTYKFKGFSQQLKPAFIALIVALFIGGWWVAYIYFTDLDAVHTIATKETAAWSSRNVRPWYYYWPFFTQSGMWTFFAFIGLLYPFIKKRVSNLKAYQFTLIWTVSTVVLLSLIPEKKSRYLLPVLIPLALNTSFYIHYLIIKGKELAKIDKWIANFGFGLLGLIALVFPIYSFGKFYESSMAYPFNFWIQAVVLISISFLIFRSLWQKNYKQSFYTSIALMCSIMFLSLPLVKGLYNNSQFKNLSHLKQNANIKNVPLFVKDYIAPELLWEYGSNISVLKSEKDVSSFKKLGIITQKELSKTLLKDFKITLKERIDLNYIVKKSGKGNNRLITQFYLLEKKRDSLN